MPQLDGSCHCGAVRFSVQSPTPYPYMRCYCSICRKTDGGGGYAINLMGDAATLAVTGEDALTVYQAMIDGEQSPARRHFCRHCGTALWLFDPRWPELVHPFASAIDTPLPKAPEHIEIMLSYKPDWVPLPRGRAGDARYNEYPEESLAEWHERHGMSVREPE